MKKYDPKKDVINLVRHNPNWKFEAQQEIKNLKKVLDKALIVDMQHIGSTAISSIKSKPVIDILIGVKCHPFDDKEKFILQLKSLGYIFWCNTPDKSRLFFVKGLPPFGKKRTHHVHIVEFNSKQWRKHIWFRDHLMQNPNIAKKYEQIKIDLAKQFANNREAYTTEKGKFIENILQNAKNL